MATEPWDGADRRNQLDSILTLTADIVAAHVSNNTVAVNDLPQLIANVHGALGDLGSPPTPEKAQPKVAVRSSIKPAYIVCLECGMKLKMMKRHLKTHHATTPAEYRAKWNLSGDYPMVAPEYGEQRRKLAVEIGLGTKRRKVARKK
jgi:predicted transcriptional regulator